MKRIPVDFLGEYLIVIASVVSLLLLLSGAFISVWLTAHPKEIKSTYASGQ
ncbi:MAG TPA: hypothetical protein VLH19_00260 [Patescibacteria group bacterium]|nr:hypothetical protein [Patescibacteria group bacterium]